MRPSISRIRWWNRCSKIGLVGRSQGDGQGRFERIISNHFANSVDGLKGCRRGFDSVLGHHQRYTPLHIPIMVSPCSLRRRKAAVARWKVVIRLYLLLYRGDHVYLKSDIYRCCKYSNCGKLWRGASLADTDLGDSSSSRHRRSVASGQ
jgi:hypothetical protein